MSKERTRRLQDIARGLSETHQSVTTDAILTEAYRKRVLKRRDQEVVRTAHTRIVQRAIADMRLGQLRLFLAPPGQPRTFVPRDEFLVPGPLRDRKAEAALRHCLSELAQIEPGEGEWFEPASALIADLLRRRRIRRAA